MGLTGHNDGVSGDLEVVLAHVIQQLVDQTRCLHAGHFDPGDPLQDHLQSHVDVNGPHP